MNDRYDAGYGGDQYELVGYDEYGRPVYRQVPAQDVPRQSYDPYAQHGYSYDPYATGPQQPVPAYEGQYYTSLELTENPTPVQKPHPPIMIGGSGEKVTLRLVAQYAQFCNVGGDPETVGRLLEALKGHCDRLGRDYDAITKSAYTMVMIGKDEAALKKALC